jgi:hypothetical protein
MTPELFRMVMDTLVSGVMEAIMLQIMDMHDISEDETHQLHDLMRFLSEVQQHSSPLSHVLGQSTLQHSCRAWPLSSKCAENLISSLKSKCKLGPSLSRYLKVNIDL